MYWIYMTFFELDGWHVQFLDEDQMTKLRLKLRFQNIQQLTDFIDRTPTIQHPAFRKRLSEALASGNGGVFLSVTESQYLKLK